MYENAVSADGPQIPANVEAQITDNHRRRHSALNRRYEQLLDGYEKTLIVFGERVEGVKASVEQMVSPNAILGGQGSAYR